MRLEYLTQIAGPHDILDQEGQPVGAASPHDQAGAGRARRPHQVERVVTVQALSNSVTGRRETCLLEDAEEIGHALTLLMRELAERDSGIG